MRFQCVKRTHLAEFCATIIESAGNNLIFRSKKKFRPLATAKKWLKMADACG